MIELNIYQVFILIIFSFLIGREIWNKGVRVGAERAVEKLHQIKVIAFDNKGNIKPNPFFDGYEETEK